MPMRILITGGCGFIGSHVTERLLAEGHKAFVVDDLNDFYSPILKQHNLAALQTAGLSAFHHCDIRDTDRIRQIVSQIAPDAVIHLAARGGVRPSLEQPFLYEDVNVRGTLAVLEAARAAHVGKFIFASSSSVYGAHSSLPFSEDDLSLLPISPYAATKIAGEKMCFVYSHLYGLSVVCLRLFTVYGPRQRPDLAIRKFADAIDAGHEIELHGEGQSSRDYTYVGDIVQGIVSALRYECTYDIFNLGSSSPISLETVVAALEEAIGKRAVVRRTAGQPGDVSATYANIAKARKCLGYEPVMPFQEGIQHFVNWRREKQQRQS